MNRSVYVIAGPNGSGKTTFAREFLPYYSSCDNFVNADLIAAGFSPLIPEKAAIRAGRLLLSEIKRLAANGEDFGFETTLAGRGHLRLLRELKRQDYSIHLFYLSLSSVDLALQRIRGRVETGGHDVPEAVVRRRFLKSLHNFMDEYRSLADIWFLFDNSATAPRVVAQGKGPEATILHGNLYRELISRYHEKQ